MQNSTDKSTPLDLHGLDDYKNDPWTFRAQLLQ